MDSTVSEIELTSQAVTALREAIAADILLAKKNAVLYPRNHPAVLKAIETLETDLSRFVARTGSLFALATDPASESGEPRGARAKSDSAVLGRLLRRHLVREVTLSPGVLTEELYEFTLLLRDDLFKRGLDAASLSLDPESWVHIRLQFFSPEEMPDGFGATGTLLEAASGVHSVLGLDAWLGELPPELRESAEKSLMDPALLRRIAGLRRVARRHAASTEGSPTAPGRVNLLSRILGMVLPRPKTLGEVGQSISTLNMALENVQRFIEDNEDLLALESGTVPEDKKLSLISKYFGETLPAGSRLCEEAHRLQIQKQRTAFLFQSGREAESLEEGLARAAASVEASVPAAAPAPARDGAAPPAGGGAMPTLARAPLQVRLDSLSYDLEVFARAAVVSGSPRQTLDVILELLRSPTSRGRLREAWNEVLGIAGRAGSSAEEIEGMLRVLGPFHAETKLFEAEELISTLLSKLENPSNTQRIIEEVLLPAVGIQTVRGILEQLLRATPSKLVPVLASFVRGREPQLRSTAGACLLCLAAEPEHLAEWVIEDPQALARSDLRNMIQKTPPAELYSAFGRIFARASSEAGERIVQAVAPGAGGMEKILFAAIHFAPPVVRRSALARLAPFPDPEAVELLIGLVRESNAQDSPSLPDVAAALSGLKGMDDPRARAFILEVAHSRSWFRHVYRRNIRALLRGTAMEATDTNGAEPPLRQKES